MPQTIVSVPLAHLIYYKLPKGIKNLQDDRIEWYKFNYYLNLKLKDTPEVLEIEPSIEDEEGSYYEEDQVEYPTKEDVPFISDDEDDEEY